jgi:hypothetical protein
MSRAQILKHMSVNDIPLFATYLFSPEGQTYTAWEFDVLVGNPDSPGPFYPLSQRRQAMYLNALKIDAIGWLFSTPRLIECKPNGGLAALGQIMGYQKWYEIIFGTKPSGVIVCARMSKQIQTLCLLADIQVRIVTPANDLASQQAVDYVRPLIKHLSILPQLQAVS